MATGETKLSYLDVVDDIQDGDTVPILRDGKNYMSKGLAQVSADLTDMAHIKSITNFLSSITITLESTAATVIFVQYSTMTSYIYWTGNGTPRTTDETLVLTRDGRVLTIERTSGGTLTAIAISEGNFTMS